MSHHTPATTTAVPASAAPPPDAPPPDADNFTNFFADVSHHGASLFELLAMPPAAPDLTSAFPHAPPPHPPATFNPADARPAAFRTVQSPAKPALRAQPAAKQAASPSASASASLPPAPAISKRPAAKRRSARASPAHDSDASDSSGDDDPTASPPPKLPGGAAGVPASQPGQTGQRAPPPPPPPPQQQQQQHTQSSPASASRGGASAGALARGESSNSLDAHAHAPPKHTHNSHTRRCRAKVNNKFQELLHILPAPPPKTGVKHKAQILDYTIRVFRDIHARKMQLEAELALSSRAHLNTWVTNIVARAASLHDVLAPFLSLICTKGSWKYSEAWVSAHEPVPDVRASVEGASAESNALAPNLSNILIGPQSRLRLGLAVIPSLGNTDDPDLQLKLERFRDRSRPYGCRARVDLPGRIMCTMRPEWLPSLGDQEAFQRAGLASDASLAVCFGIPVFIRGQVAAVAMFFDTEQRPYDAKCIDLAEKVASLLGSTYAASALRRSQCR